LWTLFGIPLLELDLSEPPHPASTARARMVPMVAAALIRMVGPLLE